MESRKTSNLLGAAVCFSLVALLLFFSAARTTVGARFQIFAWIFIFSADLVAGRVNFHFDYGFQASQWQPSCQNTEPLS